MTALGGLFLHVEPVSSFLQVSPLLVGAPGVGLDNISTTSSVVTGVLQVARRTRRMRRARKAVDLGYAGRREAGPLKVNLVRRVATARVVQ